MRVALLTNFIPPYRVSLFEALAKEVGELRIFISTRMESNRDWQPRWGSLDVVVQRTLTLKRKWRAPAFVEDHDVHLPYDTLLQLRGWRPDVIITGELSARSLQAVAFARWSGTPVLLWATLSDRLESERGRLRTTLRRWLVRHADGIIVNGEEGARYFRRFGCTEQDLLRIPYTVDMTELLGLPLQRAPGRDHDLLFSGALSLRKGIHLLVDGLSRWADANPEHRASLTCIGDGPLRTQLQAKTVPANVHIRWVGAVPYEELAAYYRAAGVFVFPSLGDEWGVAVNEALAAGLPVLGSAYSQAVEELVRDSVNGWVFLPEDAEVVAEALDRALNTGPPRLRGMRRAARESVRALTPESAAARIAARLREVMAP